MDNLIIWSVVVFLIPSVIGAISVLLLGSAKAKRYPGGAIFFGVATSFTNGHPLILGIVLGVIGHGLFVLWFSQVEQYIDQLEDS